MSTAEAEEWPEGKLLRMSVPLSLQNSPRLMLLPNTASPVKGTLGRHLCSHTKNQKAGSCCMSGLDFERQPGSIHPGQPSADLASCWSAAGSLLTLDPTKGKQPTVHPDAQCCMHFLHFLSV